MEFENLKGILGEAYHENITAEEINSFFAGKNFADLSTGQYVDKSKYDREVQTLNKTIADQKATIDSKMSDDEKKVQAEAEKDNLIKQLQAQLQQNTLLSNTDLVKSTTSNIKSILDIKDDDTEYKGFIESIVSEDRVKSNNIAEYVTKLVKDAYAKGQKDSTKDAMGGLGKSYKSGGTGSKPVEESLGAKLGKLSATQKPTIDYFARYKNN